MDVVISHTKRPDKTETSPIIYTRGRTRVATQSSVLVSSSPFLNDPRLREWLSTESLRRNGVDYPLLYGVPFMLEAVEQTRDIDKVESLIKAERRKNPALDRWFEERFVSSFGLEDLAGNPSGSVGRQLFEHMDSLGLSPELTTQRMLDPNWVPDSDLEFFTLRFNQIHDFNHLLGEVGFDVVAEMWPAGLVTGNIFTHIGPELAGELLRLNTLTLFPWLIRTILHYPAAWPTLWRNMSYGYQVGQQSDLLFTARYEDILHLPPAEARAKIGMRGVTGRISSEDASLVFGEGRTML